MRMVTMLPPCVSILPLAEQGDTFAQFNLGLMYDNGEGVPQDYAEALKWFRLAAERGNVTAQYNVGVMYDNGRGVPEDDAEAVKWYRLAAEQGYAKAQGRLGSMYKQGQGVPEDYVEAYAWYNLGAAQGKQECNHATKQHQEEDDSLPDCRRAETQPRFIQAHIEA